VLRRVARTKTWLQLEIVAFFSKSSPLWPQYRTYLTFSRNLQVINFILLFTFICPFIYSLANYVPSKRNLLLSIKSKVILQSESGYKAAQKTWVTGPEGPVIEGASFNQEKAVKFGSGMDKEVGVTAGAANVSKCNSSGVRKTSRYFFWAKLALEGIFEAL